MAPKSKKSRKNKKVPVRIISPQTVEMPQSVAPVCEPAESRAVPGSPAAAVRQPSTILMEIRRIGIIAAVILAILVILSLIF